MARSRPTDGFAGILARVPRVACAAAVLAAGFLASSHAASETTSPAPQEARGASDVHRSVERVVAFADVHGAHEELVALLQSVGVVDAELRWSAGTTHVVSLGDLLDRGADSRRVMDLLMRLQRESREAGGALHVVLGNHEAMNVLGDLRYVADGEFAAYAADEDPAERAARRAEFLGRNPGATTADFEKAFPPGYFGHRRLLGPDGPYGRWLLSLPAAVVAGDAAFMHGGPSVLLHGRSIDRLNRDYAAALAEYLSALDTLEQAGLVRFEDDFGKRADAAVARLATVADGAERSRLTAAVERLRVADDHPLLGPAGPNWYRGAALCNECAEADVLRPWLSQVGVQRLVVGHTVARNNLVASRFDGALVKLDAGMNRAVYKGRPAALLLERGAPPRVAYALPTVAPAPVPSEAVHVSSESLDEATVADVLARGTIAVTAACAPGISTVNVTHEGRTVTAVFEAAPRAVVERELAAWRLDRVLGLGLVPATVARSHDGREGVLQGRPEQWASERDRQHARNGVRAGLSCQSVTVPERAEPARRPLEAQGRPPRLPGGGPCDAKAQYQLAYAFDALIGNDRRTPDQYVYDVESSALLLTGHGAAFDTTVRLPEALEAVLGATGAEMQSRLRRLDATNVADALGAAGGKREAEALLERRDRILELARKGGR
ncbi:MAG: hypothetical protein EHM60_00730 [Lysobacterales bacterium]|jgi:hypothetical protein|nr:MAG: hypothetical protein EHM60_00730 [Xanthomonadales bacterium]